MEEKNKQFYKWLIKWIEQNKDTVLMFFQLPNNLASNSIKGNDEIMLEHIQFYRTDKYVDHRVYIQYVMSKADEFGVTVFISKKIPNEYIHFLETKEFEYDNKYLIKKK